MGKRRVLDPVCVHFEPYDCNACGNMRGPCLQPLRAGDHAGPRRLADAVRLAHGRQRHDLAQYALTRWKSASRLRVSEASSENSGYTRLRIRVWNSVTVS